MENNIALVTGATGCIGYALARHLVASGHYTEVRALVRQSAADLPEGVIPFMGALDDLRALKEVVQGVSVVFHAAAKVHEPHGERADFFHDNVDGTQNLLDAASGVSRFLFFSTVAVYGETTPSEGLPENTLPAPVTPYAESKLVAEARVLAWGEANERVATILRVATVYGPRDRGNMARMLHAVARRRFLLIGHGENRKTCVALENVIQAAACLAVAPPQKVSGRYFVIADDHPYSLKEIRAEMVLALQRAGYTVKSRPPLAIPLSVAVLLAQTIGVVARLRNKRAPVTCEQIRRLAASNVYHNTALEKMTGCKPATTLAEGMTEAARWYKETRTNRSYEG